MYKYSILTVAAIFCCAQCIPLEATQSASSSSSQLHLVVNNSTKSTNYHLTPVMNELENIDQEIDDQLQAILPYLNFFFDSLLGHPKAADEDDCINDMVIELVPDEHVPPSTPKKGDKSEKKSQDKPAPSPDTANTDDKSIPKPHEVPTPEKPGQNSQSKP